ncbi:MAG: carboxypeptidase-like regulatory domain-containing protein [Thermoanaerobaculia bacterium]|nr:carboxypeptidase-like regulatory domain-containing protein [Thermoanaerobaculia bacterium]
MRSRTDVRSLRLLLVLAGIALAGSLSIHAQTRGVETCPEGAPLSVVDGRGAPIEGAEVVLDPGTDFSVAWHTDQTGGFDFSCFPACSYRLIAEAAGFEPRVREVDLMADTKLQMTLAMDSNVSAAALLSSHRESSVVVLDAADSQDWEDHYVRVDQVEFECTARSCDSDPSEDRCLAGLGQVAESLEVDAVVPTEVTTHGRGHAGADIWRVSCRGIAVRKQQSGDLTPSLPGAGEYELKMAATWGSQKGTATTGRLVLFAATTEDRSPRTGEIADDFGDPPLLWGHTTLDPGRVGIPTCEGDVPPDSEDPVYPGVVVIESSPVDDLPALLISTLTNIRDGSLYLDGCGVGLFIEERTPSGWRGKWREWGIVQDGRGTFTIRRTDSGG